MMSNLLLFVSKSCLSLYDRINRLDQDEGDLAIHRYKERVLDAVKNDIVLDASEGWVLWLDLTTPHGFYTAASLRVIADELDRRNEELFTDAV